MRIVDDQAFIRPERPMLQPLGDSAILVRFRSRLEEAANRRVIAFTNILAETPISGVIEVAPSLVAVLLRYDPLVTRHADIEGEIRLRINIAAAEPQAHSHTIPVVFGGDFGPGLANVAGLLGMSEETFIARHNASPLRVLATGFAPGFVYCGFHPPDMILPRRDNVRASVPAGSVLFAAGQTAIAATDIPTGWQVIGRTSFRNFVPAADPPTILRAGDQIRFEAG